MARLRSRVPRALWPQRDERAAGLGNSKLRGPAMPAKRVKAKARCRQITEAAAAEFIETDCCALRRSLGLRPWEFAISKTADRAKAESWTVEKIMDHSEQIE